MPAQSVLSQLVSLSIWFKAGWLNDDWNPLPNVSEKLNRRLGSKTIVKLTPTGITMLYAEIDQLTALHPVSPIVNQSVILLMFDILKLTDILFFLKVQTSDAGQEMTSRGKFWEKLGLMKERVSTRWNWDRDRGTKSNLLSLCSLILWWTVLMRMDLCVISEPFSCSLRPSWPKTFRLTLSSNSRQTATYDFYSSFIF